MATDRVERRLTAVLPADVAGYSRLIGIDEEDTLARLKAARGDKAVRAQSMRGRMALDGLYVPTRASWLADFRAELLSFPAGGHDDQVDAIGLVGQLLQQMVAPAKPQPIVRPARDRWDRLFAGRGESINWKVV